MFAALGTGGPVIAILALLSVASVALIVFKVAQMARARSGHARRSDALRRWADEDHSAALALLADAPAPADRLTRYALEATQKKMPRKPLEAELTRRGNAEVARMGRGLRLLELIAMVSPLLGLLGTVLGMIQSFQELEMAQGAANASVLAGGIWQALLTTAAGLIVAIPAAIGAGLLGARVDGVAEDIEAAVGQVFLLEDTGTLPSDA